MVHRRSRYVGAVVLSAVIAAGASPTFAFRTGITGLTADSVAGCNMCHNGGSTPTVTISGPTLVAPGDTNEYLLQVFEVGGQHAGGLDVGTTAGSLALGGSASTSTQLLSGEITHTNAKAGNGTSVDFSFLWTAPMVNGMARLRGWGNAVNGNLQFTGDQAAYATLDIQVGATGTPTLTPTVTPTPTPIQHDAVVRPARPLFVTLPAMAASVTKTFSVKVLNVDPAFAPPVTIQLDQTSDCPAGVSVTQPDFDATMLSDQNTVVMSPGQVKTGRVSVIVTPSAFIGFNDLAPHRCTLTFTASHPLLVMNTDPSPSNNVATVDLNVIDRTDPQQAGIDEIVVRSRKALSLVIPKNKPSPMKRAAMLLTNADPPAEVPGDLVTLGVDLSACPWLTATIDANPAAGGLQPSVTVKGSKSVRGVLVFTADPMQVLTPNRKAPLRCRAAVTAAGPAIPDPVPSNNVTNLEIDVIDKNDE